MIQQAWKKKFVTERWWIALVAILSAASILQAENMPDPLPDEVSVSQAKAKWEAGALVLDVREPGEWDQGHIPRAVHIPIGQLEARLGELPKQKQIIVVCRFGGRSAMGRNILKKAGFANVTSMAGGMTAWKEAGYPITPQR